MKALLLGEFSSLHKYLKEGLLELGIDVTLVANGDGWKKIGGADYNLFDKSDNKLVRKYNLYIQPFFKLRQWIDKYDVVQMINPEIYSVLINYGIIQKIVQDSKVISVCACGEDYHLVKAYYEKKFKYHVFDYDKKTLEDYNLHRLKGYIKVRNDKKIINLSDVVIPSGYDYKIAYQNETKCYKAIPFPVNVRDIIYQDNIVKEKIIFFHGLNRELAKGTPFIREALEKIKEKYPNDVEVIIEGHMPFDQYEKIMNQANVVLDQCCAESYGMNAVIAMAKGKVVMAGNSDIGRIAYGISSSPVIHIEPNVDQIYKQLEWVLENKTKIMEMGRQSREYAEKMHDHVKIASQYVAAWNSTGKL